MEKQSRYLIGGIGKGMVPDLYIDNEHLDQNTDILVNPNKAMLSKSEVSDDIKSIEVFSAGFFLSQIINNGEWSCCSSRQIKFN